MVAKQTAMPRPMVVVFWFVAAALTEFGWLTLSQFMMVNGEIGPFDRFSFNWMLLKSGYYGVIGVMIGFSVLLLFSRARRGWVPLATAVLLFGADQATPSWKPSPVDKAIAFMGSRLTHAPKASVSGDE